MLKKVFLMGGLISLLLLTTVSCGGTEAKKEPVTKPVGEEAALESTQNPVSNPASTPAPPELKISGTCVIPAEAKGKIELIHRLTRGYKQYPQYPSILAPEIEIEVKNIGNEPLEIGGSKYDRYYFKIVSKDEEGQVLEEKTLTTKLDLRPKEIKTFRTELFPSDETRSYEIIVDYRKVPKITGTYVENSELSHLTVSHQYVVKDDSLYVEGEIKGLATKTVGGTTVYTETIQVKITFKDVDGNIISSSKGSLLGSKFIFNFPPGEKGAKVKTYELTMVKV